jgi:hypothetical protein
LVIITRLEPSGRCGRFIALSSGWSSACHDGQALNPPPVYQCSIIALTAVKLELWLGRRTRIGHRSGSDANLMPIMVAAHARTYPETDHEREPKVTAERRYPRLHQLASHRAWIR